MKAKAFRMIRLGEVASSLGRALNVNKIGMLAVFCYCRGIVCGGGFVLVLLSVKLRVDGVGLSARGWFGFVNETRLACWEVMKCFNERFRSGGNYFAH